jgi:hypothetical protein
MAGLLELKLEFVIPLELHKVHVQL